MKLEEAIKHAIQKSKIRPCGQSMTHVQKAYDCAQDHKQLAIWLQELKERQESDLRPATKFLGNTTLQQYKHIKSELDEVNLAMFCYNEDDPEYGVQRIAEELTDLQMSCCTMLEILGYNEAKRREMRRKVIEKNRSRGYFERSDHDGGTSN